MSFGIGPGCDGCGMCVLACPRGAIRFAGDEGVTPYEVLGLYCNDCGKCAIVCGPRAISQDPDWAVCRERGCPMSSRRMSEWACTEGWARCSNCGSALWKEPGGNHWLCARCELETRVVCPKIRKVLATGEGVDGGDTDEAEQAAIS